VIARLEDGNVWKYSRYFDNPQFWSGPGTPAPDDLKSTVKDVVVEQKSPTPVEEGIHDDVKFLVTVKRGERPEEFEMYNVTKDPMELHNLTTTGYTRLSRTPWLSSPAAMCGEAAHPCSAMFSASRCVGRRHVAHSTIFLGTGRSGRNMQSS